MVKQNAVETSVGKFVLQKPTAGLRNKHMEAAETADGIKMTTLMIRLLPDCVAEHPFEGSVSVKEELDKLDPEDYDLLVDGLRPLMGRMYKGDVEKKSEKPSGQSDSQPTDGSKTSS